MLKNTCSEPTSNWKNTDNIWSEAMCVVYTLKSVALVWDWLIGCCGEYYNLFCFVETVPIGQLQRPHIVSELITEL